MVDDIVNKLHVKCAETFGEYEVTHESHISNDGRHVCHQR
jgi:hypothetical protein